MKAMLCVNEEAQQLAVAELREEHMLRLYPVGQREGLHIGLTHRLLQVEELAVGIEQEITVVILLHGGRVARHFAGREAEALVRQHTGVAGTLPGIGRIRVHDDEFHPFPGKTEGVRRHLQVDTLRHGLQQEVQPRLRSIDRRRTHAEVERRLLHLARTDRDAEQTVRETFVGYQLTHVEQRQQAVHFVFGISVPGRVLTGDAHTFGIPREDEIVQQRAVHDKTGGSRLCRQEGIAPGQLPHRQHGKGDKQEYLANTYHRLVEFSPLSIIVSRL